jgi:O-antigen/teichoic acid export membrane protein
MFPAFARTHTSSLPESGETLLQHTVMISLAAFACVLLSLHLLSAEVIHIVYGDKWATAAPMLSLLAFVGLFRGAARTFTPFLLGTNRADLDAKAKVIETLIFIPAVLVLVPQMGASGAAYAGIASYFFAAAARLVFASRLVRHGRKLVIPVLTLTALIVISYIASRYVGTLHVPAFVSACLLSLLIATSLAIVQGGRIRESLRVFRTDAPG